MHPIVVSEDQASEARTDPWHAGSSSIAASLTLMAIRRLRVLRIDVYRQRKFALEPPMHDFVYDRLGLLVRKALTAHAERPADDVDVQLVRRHARHCDRHLLVT